MTLTAFMSSRSLGLEMPQERLSRTSAKVSTGSRTPVRADTPALVARKQVESELYPDKPLSSPAAH